MEIGDSSEDYLNKNHYSNNRGTRFKVLSDIEKTIKYCDTGSLTRYFKDNKANIPPWIIVNDLSFSTVIFWYDILDNQLKEKIRHDYFNSSNLYDQFHEKFFFNTLHFLREYRNKVAHGKIHFQEKTKYFIHSESAKHFFSNTLITDDLISLSIGKKDLFAAVTGIIGFLLDDNLLIKFIEELTVSFLPYINPIDLKPTKTIGGESIYQLYDLPEDMYQRIYNYINLK